MRATETNATTAVTYEGQATPPSGLGEPVILYRWNGDDESLGLSLIPTVAWSAS